MATASPLLGPSTGVFWDSNPCSSQEVKRECWIIRMKVAFGDKQALEENNEGNQLPLIKEPKGLGDFEGSIQGDIIN